MKSKSSNHGKFYCRRNIFAVTAAVTIFAIVVDVFLYFVFVDVRTAFTFMEKSIGWTDCSWIAGILQWFGSSNTRNHFNTVLCTNVTHSCTMWHRICVPMFLEFFEFLSELFEPVCHVLNFPILVRIQSKINVLVQYWYCISSIYDVLCTKGVYRQCTLHCNLFLESWVGIFKVVCNQIAKICILIVHCSFQSLK